MVRDKPMVTMEGHGNHLLKKKVRNVVRPKWGGRFQPL